MAYEIGVADNYTDLLERLKDFISNPARTMVSGDGITELAAIDSDIGSGEPSQAWVIDRWDDQRDSGGVGEIEMIAHGPGSGSDEIYVGIKTESGAVGAGNYHNWIMQGFTGYSPSSDWSEQPGLITYPPRMLLWNSSIPYWFFANGRRFIIVAKVNTVYESGYMGFLLPYATPTQIPYPLVVAGSWGGTNPARYSDLTTQHNSFIDYRNSSTSECAMWLLYGPTWYGFSNGQPTRWTFPYMPNISTYGQTRDRWRENKGLLDGGACVFPIILQSSSDNLASLGELQGCYAISHESPSAEDEITIDSDTYIVFQNTFNTESYSYFAIKKG